MVTPTTKGRQLIATEGLLCAGTTLSSSRDFVVVFSFGSYKPPTSWALSLQVHNPLTIISEM